MKKRIAGLFLALTLCMGLTTPALADLNIVSFPHTDYWDNEMTPGWENEVGWNYLEEEPEQLTYWQNAITIDTLRSTGYCLMNRVYSAGDSGKSLGVALYSDAPARLTLLQRAARLNYGGVSELAIEADGSMEDTGHLTPTCLIPCENSSEDRNAGTYWDLPEGFYALNVMAGPAVYIVVGSPKNITLPDANGASSTPDSAAGAVSAFNDVKPGHWCYDAVIWAVDKDITTGTGNGTTFSPDLTCTRGQVVTFLWRAMGKPAPTTTVNPFVDAPAGAYYEDAMLWAVEQDITNGTGDGTTFSPDLTCTSSQVVTFLWRAVGKPAAENDGAAWYSEAVAWANGLELLNGLAKPFAPENPSPRADIVTYLYRALNK